MAQLNYEIPDELHRLLKMEAAERGLTLKATVVGALIGVMLQLHPERVSEILFVDALTTNDE